MKKYGQATPPDYDMKNLKFPIAVMSGSDDKMANPTDVAWTVNQFKDQVIFNHQYEMGHMSFAIGKEMSWFTVDAMAIVNHYNEKCDSSTYASKFTEGVQKCIEKEDS